MADIWLSTPNPRELSPPPQWWQDLVYDYDKMLRVMPSQKDYAYRLCRVVRAEAQMGLQAMVVHKHPDTVEMIKHGVIPISTLSGRWKPAIVAELASRDIWAAHPDAQTAVDIVEQRLVDSAARVEARRDAEGADELDQRSADAYKFIQYTKGERVGLRDINRGRGPRSVKVLTPADDSVTIDESSLAPGARGGTSGALAHDSVTPAPSTP